MLCNLERVVTVLQLFHNMKQERLEPKSSMLDHNLDHEFQTNQAVMETVQIYSYASQNGTLLESMYGWKESQRLF